MKKKIPTPPTKKAAVKKTKVSKSKKVMTTFEASVGAGKATATGKAKPTDGGAIVGKKVVFTGQLAKLPRRNTELLAQKLGAVVENSVGKDCAFLVEGPYPNWVDSWRDGPPGSKLKAAKKYGVSVIDETQWWQLVEAAKKASKKGGKPAQFPLEVSGFVTISALTKGTKAKCNDFGPDAVEPFPSTPTIDLFFDDAETCLAAHDAQSGGWLYGKPAVKAGLQAFLNGPFAGLGKGGKLKTLLLRDGGRMASTVWWDGDATGLPEDLRDRFLAAVGAAGATVVWKQLRGVDWPVESVEQLQQHVENPDSGSYEDFIAVY